MMSHRMIPSKDCLDDLEMLRKKLLQQLLRTLRGHLALALPEGSFAIQHPAIQRLLTNQRCPSHWHFAHPEPEVAQPPTIRNWSRARLLQRQNLAIRNWRWPSRRQPNHLALLYRHRRSHLQPNHSALLYRHRHPC